MVVVQASRILPVQQPMLLSLGAKAHCGAVGKAKFRGHFQGFLGRLWGSMRIQGDLKESLGILGGLWGSLGISEGLWRSLGISGDLKFETNFICFEPI